MQIQEIANKDDRGDIINVRERLLAGCPLFSKKMKDMGEGDSTNWYSKCKRIIMFESPGSIRTNIPYSYSYSYSYSYNPPFPHYEVKKHEANICVIYR